MPGLDLSSLFSASFKRSSAALKFAPESKITVNQWLEVAFIPLLAIGLAWLASPSDPMLSRHPFPWLWFAPLLVSLRYGVLPGLMAIVPLLLNSLLAAQLGVLQTPYSTEFFTGSVLLVLLCGEFSDIWRDRNLRMEETNLYSTERLSRLTKRHLLLNLSHDGLEQEMLARPGSLRDALVRLRRVVIESGGAPQTMSGSAGLLQLLAQYVNIESAALYTLKNEEKGWVLGKCVQELGEPKALLPDDPLLARALESKSLVHIASQDISKEQTSQQLVVAPLIAGNDALIGVLAITQMPFYSLNVDNMQMVSVILAYYADNISIAPEVHQIQKRLPTIPPLFAEELQRMVLIERKAGLESHLLIMTFAGAQIVDGVTQYLPVKRGLDLYWQTYVKGQPVIAVLMPFASLSAKEGFIERVEVWLKNRYGGTLDSLGILVNSINFAQGDPVSALEHCMRD